MYLRNLNWKKKWRILVYACSYFLHSCTDLNVMEGIIHVCSDIELKKIPFLSSSLQVRTPWTHMNSRVPSLETHILFEDKPTDKLERAETRKLSYCDRQCLMFVKHQTEELGRSATRKVRCLALFGLGDRQRAHPKRGFRFQVFDQSQKKSVQKTWNGKKHQDSIKN